MVIRARISFNVQGLLFISLLLFSNKAAFSQTEFYIPKALITPVHTHKHELHVSLGKGGGYDANISYALIKHFAVFTTGTLSKGTSRRISFWGDRFNIYKNDYALKAGIGYFTAINHKLVNYVESYAGLGSYKVDNYWYFLGESRTSGIETKAGFWNIFWQIQATHKMGRHEFTGAFRLAYSKYNYLQYRNLSPSYDHVKTTLDGLWGITLDPAISYSYLVKKIKFNIQAGGSGSLNSMVTLDETYYRREGNQIIASKVPGITKMSIGAPIGRVSIQHNFDF